MTNLWFNTGAFAVPVVAVRADGNAGRNILDKPGERRVDVGMFRLFKLRALVKLEFRAELTNALNLVNLSGPTTNLNSGNFGTTLTANQMRQSQLGLRLTW